MIVQKMMVKKIKHLDMGFNPALKSDFYQVIADVIYDETCSLEFISFEGNLMGDKNLRILSESIMHNARLRVLNLSKNDITDKSATNICKILDHCTSLRGLFLHMNKFQGKGGLQIANTLRENRNLEVFDISFNNIGGGAKTKDQQRRKELGQKYATAWAECFRRNTTMIHVDISHNNLRLNQMEIIAEGLRPNNTILGIHLKGNEGEVDA